MKTWMILTIVGLFFVSSQSLAGGSGGGGVLMSTVSFQSHEAILHTGEKNGNVRFQYGQRINNKWHIEEIEMSAAELSDDTDATRALEESRTLGEWVEL